MCENKPVLLKNRKTVLFVLSIIGGNLAVTDMITPGVDGLPRVTRDLLLRRLSLASNGLENQSC